MDGSENDLNDGILLFASLRRKALNNKDMFESGGSSSSSKLAWVVTSRNNDCASSAETQLHSSDSLLPYSTPGTAEGQIT
ncbi:hypothetical protein AAFF_G00139760 [Aldrovandia affinis]|uniref:Uncharacterized protein n=1 Tax=Aldrovandia affinis TaxID=143900 RepID=A0AAD7TCS3_9TELE|nr:hypothetical protein AAFF_G00139760 [Aldrovandia affinis]